MRYLKPEEYGSDVPGLELTRDDLEHLTKNLESPFPGVYFAFRKNFYGGKDKASMVIWVVEDEESGRFQ